MFLQIPDSLRTFRVKHMTEELGIPMEAEESEAGSSRAASGHAISAASDGDKIEAEEREGEIQGDVDGDEVDEDDEEEGEEAEGEEECAFRFESGTNPLDYVGDDASGVQFYQQFERLEYEALAKKKRQGLAEGERLAKKPRQEDIAEAAMEEIMEAMNGRRRRSRKIKKKGRRLGSKNKLSPEIARMLGDATLHYAHERYTEAISVLNEVVRLAPNLPDSYNMLGLVHKALGNDKIAFEFYMLAGLLKPKDSSLWQMLLAWSMDQGIASQTMYCLSKAINADPVDISLRFYQASLYVDHGDYRKAAESYEQIQRLSPDNVEALTSAAKLFLKCGQAERAFAILEGYLKSNPCDADLSVVDLLVAMLMENSEYERTLKQIEHVQTVYYSGKEMPLELKAKAGICYLHLGEMEKAEILNDVLEASRAQDHAELITGIADSFMRLGYYRAALTFYHKLEAGDGLDKGSLHLRIAQCYSSLKEKVKAIEFFYKALHEDEDNIEARLALATLFLEDAREDEALPLLSSPENIDSDYVNLNSDKSKRWWLDPKIKVKLCQLYKAKGMTEEFVDIILPLIRESLAFEEYRRQHKPKTKRRLTERDLNQRVKKVDSLQSDGVIRGLPPLATPSDRMKANRAKKLLQKRAALKEEKKAAAKAAGLEWHSESENDEPEEEPAKQAPLPNLLKDMEHRCLIIDLCKALASLQRYYEALEIIQITLRLSQKTPLAEKEELRSLGAQMAYNTMDPKHGFEYVRDIVQKHPYSFAAWSCYYKVIMGSLRNYLKHLRQMRAKYKDCVPPILIAGHQFTMLSHHQDAARDYLEAYKLLPEHPLVNLCVGTALINLALGFRLQNKHQTIAQGLAFLYNNLRFSEGSQEALFNIARACHHVGLVTMAVSYYEKVLATPVKDYPIPKLPNENWDTPENPNHSYCDLRREAAFNLHLIYKKSGALDMARQVLKDHCTI